MCERIVKPDLDGDAQNAFAPVIDWLRICQFLPWAGEDSRRREISCKFVQGPANLETGMQMESSEDLEGRGEAPDCPKD
jgi:hypothetical protein